MCKKLAQINNQSRKIISNFKSNLESIKIPKSNPELASISKSNPKPMIPSQITNIKILSLNTSKLKQFLSFKDEQENLCNGTISKNKISKKKKPPRKICKNKKFFTMRISKNANNKKSSWKNFLMDKSS